MTRLRLPSYAALVIVAVTVSAFLLTRNTRQEVRAASGPAPGFEGEERGVDDSPFNLAEPTTTAGPTTIPGGRDLGRSTTTTTTTTPQVTTTTVPTEVGLPPPDEINSICGLHDSVASFQLIWRDDSVDVRQVVEQLQSNMNRYLDVSPPEARPTVDALRTMIISAAAVLRAAGWDTSAPGPRELLRAAETQAPPLDQMVPSMNRIREIEDARC